MLKDVFKKLDYSHFQEIALVIFGVSFLAICWGVWRLRRDAAMQFSTIPIDDLKPQQDISNTLDSIQNNNPCKGVLK
ncbi:MAG: hypothetical protein ABL921_04825 [Pirellula sp.]